MTFLLSLPIIALLGGAFGVIMFAGFTGSGAAKKPVADVPPLEAGAELAVKLFEDFPDGFEMLSAPGNVTMWRHDIGVNLTINLIGICDCGINGAVIPLSEGQQRRLRIAGKAKLDEPKVEAVMILARRVKEGFMLQ